MTRCFWETLPFVHFQVLGVWAANNDDSMIWLHSKSTPCTCQKQNSWANSSGEPCPMLKWNALVEEMNR